MGSCWNSLTRPDEILARRKWFYVKTRFSRDIDMLYICNGGGAIFGLSHVAPAGTVNLGMTLRHDLGWFEGY